MGPFQCVLSCTIGVFCCQLYESITEVVEPAGEVSSAVIFLHGAAESGQIIREEVEMFIGNFSRFPNTRFIFPTADGFQFNSFPWNGKVYNMWFGITDLGHDGYFNATEIDISAKQLKKLVEEQVESGIPHKRICLVGYSSGAMMSMLFGYEHMKNLGCIGAISGFISRTTGLYKKLTTKPNELGKNMPPLYLYAGGLDIICYPSWIEDTAKAFKSAGVEVTLSYQWDGTHFINKDGVEGLLEFVEQTIM